MTRELADSLEMYGELHRYIPVLAVWNGFQVGELDVEHHERLHGTSKFGRARFWRGFLDLVTVKFLTTYTARPVPPLRRHRLRHRLRAARVLLAWMGVSKLLGHEIGTRPGAPARRAARRRRRADGVARPARRADGQPATPAQPRLDRRRRPRCDRPRTTKRPIGLAPGAPEAAAGQDAKKYGTGNPVVQQLLARWMGRLKRRARPDSTARWSTSASARASRSSACSPATRPSASSTGIDKALGRRERLPELVGAVADAGMLPVADRLRRPRHLHRAARAPARRSSRPSRSWPASPAAASSCRCRGSRGSASATSGRGKNVKRLGNDPEHVNFFTPRRLQRPSAALRRGAGGRRSPGSSPRPSGRGRAEPTAVPRMVPRRAPRVRRHAAALGRPTGVGVVTREVLDRLVRRPGLEVTCWALCGRREACHELRPALPAGAKSRLASPSRRSSPGR